jgi:hypothetical protein
LLLDIIITHQQNKSNDICCIVITRNLSSQPSFFGEKVTPFKSPSSCSLSLKSWVLKKWETIVVMQGRKQKSGLHCNELNSSSFKPTRLNRLGSFVRLEGASW